MSVCIVCGKPLTGRQRKICSDRECHKENAKEYGREYRQNNQEKLNENSRKSYLKNREKRKEYSRKYYQNNIEKLKESRRKYHQNNREKENENSHEYRLNNTEKIKEIRRKYYCHSRGLPEDWNLSKISSIEVIMKRWLQESNIEFTQQHLISFENATWTKVDFYIPEANICLYVDGDYWHSLPEVQERDNRTNKALETMGYSVARMIETEILEGNRPWWIGELISAKW